VLREHYSRCKALLFPGEEDFGIVPVEAMAAGRPVIALRRGGALETVVAGRTGLFFDEPTVESLERAVIRFEHFEQSFNPTAIASHARKFSQAEFSRQMTGLVQQHRLSVDGPVVAPGASGVSVLSATAAE
jgi:glycosyltransferase involved in cell wall biosynthesis